MKYSLIVFASAAYAHYIPSEPWTTLTPKSSSPDGAIKDHDVDFGIQIITIELSVPSGHVKRAVQQIPDGQVQANPSVSVTSPKPVAPVVNQIGDGQIQHQPKASPVPVVNQIGDGQIQHQPKASPVPVVNQIGDGQIQHQPKASPVPVLNQIGDGQVQHQPKASPVPVANQIGDGQIQHQPTASPVPAANQIGDGQVQATGTPSPAQKAGDKFQVACSTSDSLKMRLKKGVLTDSKGRIGAIVANRQFQFDGPPPQAGTIYAAGWSITTDGFLALGNQTEFYQCLSGDFYNLYDESVGGQCAGVKLSIIDLVSC